MESLADRGSKPADLEVVLHHHVDTVGIVAIAVHVVATAVEILGGQTPG